MKIKFHFKMMYFINIFKFLFIVGISSFFWWKIYPLLNPRLKTPADFANAYWDFEVLCRWRFRVRDGAESVRVRNISVRAYTDREEETDSNPQETATGRQPYVGSCAISRDLWGWLIKEGYGIYIPELDDLRVIAEDVMGNKDLRGNLIRRRVDIFYHKEDLEEAKKILIENTTIYISKIEREKEKK